MKQTPQRFVSGFVTVIGRPNVGKSTLLNALVGQRLAIVTPKPQTTRDRILGIRTDDESQILFLDTPGIHEARRALNRAMVERALATLLEVDVVLFMVDAERQVRAAGSVDAADAHVLDRVAAVGKPTLLVLNKVDRVADKPLLLPVIEAFQQRHPFVAAVPISALRHDGLEPLLAEIRTQLPEGPAYYDADTLTDRPLRFLVAETIREKVIVETREELPYSAAVSITAFQEEADIVRIEATIHVERAGQKAIVIGQGGQMLKRIGTAARHDIEELVGRRVALHLFVRIEPDWTRQERALRKLGYGPNE